MLANQVSTADLQARYFMGQLARKELIPFAWMTMPVPGEYYGIERSRYVVCNHHRYVARALEQIRSGAINRLEIELPPRHGKSELSVRKFVPFFMGLFPGKSAIVVTHTDHLAREHGRDCRDIFQSAAYRLAFPERDSVLRVESQASDRLQLQAGGVATFSGRGGLGAGIGADLMIFDDFFKNSEEAESVTVRESAWRTFISDCQSRLNTENSPVIMIGTRRHMDDVQGRLFDSNNPHYDEREAKRWARIRLPAMAEENDPLGREVDTPLWPEKFSATYYINRRNHRSDVIRMDYETQDQCKPAPAEGNYFKKKWLLEYQPNELPKYLRIYATSDHAYRKGQQNDKTCLLMVGIDPSDTIWVLPDTWWQRAETDEMVEAMIGLMESRQPATWWAARDAISGSVGPFLQKRMRERKVFCWVDDEIREDRDLVRRAQSIRNRMAMGMVRWPGWAPWWGEMKQELINFPNGTHDDSVAALALLGMALDKLVKANGPYTPQTGLPKQGTLAWVKQVTMQNQAQEAAEKALKGW